MSIGQRVKNKNINSIKICFPIWATLKYKKILWKEDKELHFLFWHHVNALYLKFHDNNLTFSKNNIQNYYKASLWCNNNIKNVIKFEWIR